MKKSFFIFLCGLAVVSFAPVVTAQTGCPTGLVPCGGENCPCTTCHIFEMFKNVMDFILFFIVPPLAALMIAIGGFMLVFAYLGVGDGGPGMISQAKKLFASVAIGLVIVYGAYAIIGLFLQSIGLADWTEKIYQSWWKESFFKIECETTAPAGGGSTSGGSTGGRQGGHQEEHREGALPVEELAVEEPTLEPQRYYQTASLTMETKLRLKYKYKIQAEKESITG